MKLSELKGEKALDVLAEIIEPAVEIMQDKRVVKAAKAGKTVEIVKVACKGHKKAIIKILAVLDDADPDTYEVSVLTLPAKILELLNDPEIQMLFTSPPKSGAKKSSGKRSGSIEAQNERDSSSDTASKS